MLSQWSLVFFTLLVQSAVGNMWCVQLMLYFNLGRTDSHAIKFQLAVNLVLLLLSLVLAMAHLGKPTSSINAHRNISSSWLSREIMAVNLFVGVMAILALVAFTKPEALSLWTVMPGSLAGGVGLYAMTRVYMLRTVPAWNHPGTPLGFLGTTLLLGGVLSTVLLSLFPMVPNRILDSTSFAIYQQFSCSYMVILFGLGLKVLAASNWSHESSFKRMLPSIQLFGLGLWTFSMFFSSRPDVFLSFFAVASAFIVVGEITDRVRFYKNYTRIGI